MQKILDAIENGNIRDARQMIRDYGFIDFASMLEGWLNLDIINQETFNKAALIGLYAAGKEN
jgi:hypothetical protein